MHKSLVLIAIMLFCAVLMMGCSQAATTAATSTPSISATTSSPSPSPTASTTKPATQPAPSSTTAAPTQPISPTTAANQPLTGGIFYEAMSSSPSTPIGVPWEMGPASHGVAIPALEMLVISSAVAGGQLQPCLATSWEINSTAKPPNLVLHLRQGVKFHDGTDWNAQAAKWNIDHWLQAKQSYSATFTSVDVIDNYTIRINLSQFTNTVMDVALAGWNAQMISPTSYDQNGVAWARYHPVGTGPFTFVSYQQDVAVKYKAFANYWQKGKPYLDELQLTIIVDPTTRLVAFKAGKVYMMTGSSDKNAADMRDAGYNFVNADPSAAGVNSLIPDSNNPNSPLANQKVRAAIEYAIDKQAIVNATGFGVAQTAYQLSPTGNSFVYIPGLDERKYDVAKSKQLLVEAGYPNGFNMTITPDPTTNPNPNIVLAIQSYLVKVGIKADINIVDYGRYTDYRFNGWKNGCLFHGVSVGQNGVKGYQTTWGGSSFPSLKYPAGFLDAINAALATPTPQKDKVQAVNKIAFDDAMIIPFSSTPSQVFTAKGVHHPDVLFNVGLYSEAPGDFWMDKIVQPY
jgi:peptide/nickel transport system substrate-binding protein